MSILSVFLSDMHPDDWARMKKEEGWNEVDLRDNRYNHVIHLVSAADGATAFYTCEGHEARSEGMDLALELDSKAQTVSFSYAEKEGVWSDLYSSPHTHTGLDRTSIF